MLLGVQSVGPKVALAVLSGGPPRELLAALAAGDAARFQAVPGIGKRTAERIIVELREKVGATATVPSRRSRSRRSDDPRSLAREGLLGLGYSAQEADELLDGADGRAARGPDRPRAEDGPAMSPVREDARPAPSATAGADPGPQELPEDELDRSLRPRRLEDFVGQEALKDQLAVSIAAAASRGEALDHVLLAGPPGLGKTSLAQIVAAELEVPFVQTAGPALERKGDVAAFLTALEPRSVFFVDEIHRLPRALEETFYPAMEDGCLPITVGQGAGARVVTLDAAAVHADRRDHPDRAADHPAARPLRDPAPPRALRPRGPREDRPPLGAAARGRDRGRTAPARSRERSRGTPRVANRLLKRVRDYAEVRGSGVVTGEVASEALDLLQVDHAGPRPPRPRDPARDLREVRRRPGRPLDAGRRGRRGAGHDRGRLRALSAPARADRAHPARAGGDQARVRAPRAGAPGARFRLL